MQFVVLERPHCIVGEIVNSLYIGLIARWSKEEIGGFDLDMDSHFM